MAIKINGVTVAGSGVGVVSGGTTGQVLAKRSSDDYDTEWVDLADESLQLALDVHIADKENPHKVTADQIGAAPTSHASTETTYGVGTDSNYGHVMLSDSTSSSSAASDGIAATPSAVKAAYDLANTANTAAVTAQATADAKSTATNLVNGSATGSLRGVGTDAESDEYTMGKYAFAEGLNTVARGDYSHAEGFGSVANGNFSHAEGISYATGGNSHAEGYSSMADGTTSHAEGNHSIAAGDCQHVQGKYNIKDTTSAHIVGNGSSDVRSNAHTLDWEGNAWFAGDVYVGSTSGTNKDEGSVKLVKEGDITPENIGAAPAYTYGTEDMVDGVTPLETGKLYFVYE